MFVPWTRCGGLYVEIHRFETNVKLVGSDSSRWTVAFRVCSICAASIAARERKKPTSTNISICTRVNFERDFPICKEQHRVERQLQTSRVVLRGSPYKTSRFETSGETIERSTSPTIRRYCCCIPSSRYRSGNGISFRTFQMQINGVRAQ